MKNKVNKINNWGILNLFISYLKHNRAIIISIFVLPLIFVIAIIINYKTVVGEENVNPNLINLIIMLLWIVQSASFAIQTFLTILLDFKQSIIYRRIGLTRIKKINFLIMASIFNLILMSISNCFIFLIIIILAISFKEENLLQAIFQWQLFLSILFTFSCLIFLTSVSILMSVLIKSRTGQTIASIIVNFLIIIPLFILIFFLNIFTKDTSSLFNNLGTGSTIAIFCSSLFFINLISFFIYFLSWKFFKWYE